MRATPRARRILAPLLLAAVAVACARSSSASSPSSTAADRPTSTSSGGRSSRFIALPLALLWGLLRARLARVQVGELVVHLEETPVDGIRDELAGASTTRRSSSGSGSPSATNTSTRAGAALTVPEDGPSRAVTWIEHEGEPLAVLVHDPTLRDEPKLVEAVAAAARLALVNARLHAEVRAQLDTVKESRARIVTAADEERRRIERDLHDGAQQRLVALALELRSAQRQLGAEADPEVDQLLASTADELQVAVEELRALAHGIHPGTLTQAGLASALEALAARMPLPVSVDATTERLAPDVEATAYFVACEALTNVVKHAGRLESRGGRAARQRDARDRGVGRRGRRCGRVRRVGAARPRRSGRGARRPVVGRERTRLGHARRGGDPVRVVIAEDSVLLREGLARVLSDGGFDVVAQAANADELKKAVRRFKPDVAVVDVRMPPTQTDEGARAALEIRAEQPEVAVLLLSQVIEATHALALISERPDGFGYLLKDRVLEIDDFLEAVRRVGKGGTAIDPEVIGQLLGRRREQDPLGELTPREREVLTLMAEGLSNRGICEKLVVSPKTVETHVNSIFLKLDLMPATDEHRRVLAVLAFLRA